MEALVTDTNNLTSSITWRVIVGNEFNLPRSPTSPTLHDEPIDETILLANFPNPFNPETWIPYHLASRTDVTINIYNAQGILVRALRLGHQSAGYYTDRDSCGVLGWSQCAWRTGGEWNLFLPVASR